MEAKIAHQNKTPETSPVVSAWQSWLEYAIEFSKNASKISVLSAGVNNRIVCPMFFGFGFITPIVTTIDLIIFLKKFTNNKSPDGSSVPLIVSGPIQKFVRRNQKLTLTAILVCFSVFWITTFMDTASFVLNTLKIARSVSTALSFTSTILIIVGVSILVVLDICNIFHAVYGAVKRLDAGYSTVDNLTEVSCKKGLKAKAFIVFFKEFFQKNWRQLLGLADDGAVLSVFIMLILGAVNPITASIALAALFAFPSLVKIIFHATTRVTGSGADHAATAGLGDFTAGGGGGAGGLSITGPHCSNSVTCTAGGQPQGQSCGVVGGNGFYK